MDNNNRSVKRFVGGIGTGRDGRESVPNGMQLHDWDGCCATNKIATIIRMSPNEDRGMGRN